MGVLSNYSPLARTMRRLFEYETAPSMSYRGSLSERGKLRWEGEAHRALRIYS
jgi:hypothetical protein